jgi:oxidoreductase
MSLRLLILGATGATGSRALLAALSEPSLAAVFSFGRSSHSLPPTVDSSKLHHTSLDFEKLLEQGSTGEEAKKLADVKADVVLITLGTTRFNAGSAQAFERADREYVIAAAKAARVEGEKQRLIYLSVRFPSSLPSCPIHHLKLNCLDSSFILSPSALQSGGANSSTPFLYLKSKGLTEEALAKLGYTETLIYRPGHLAVEGGRAGKRKAFELVFSYVVLFFFFSSFLLTSSARNRFIPAFLSYFSSSIQIPTLTLGRALVKTVVAPSLSDIGKEETLKGETVRVIGNVEALELGKKE